MANEQPKNQEQPKASTPAITPTVSADDDSPRNLTREALEEHHTGLQIAAGKSPEEARAMGKKRALEMIPIDAK